VSNSGDITRLLHLWRHGDHAAENALFTQVLPSLRRIAHYLMNRERPGHTLQATELVDQIYFRLVDARDRDWRNRAHFFAIAGRAMRRYLIDYARARPRAAAVPLEGLDNLLAATSANLDTALSIDHLLTQLAAEHPDWCTVVELKYFLGLTDEEAADVLHMKLRTLQRAWLEARQWLFSHMESARAAQSSLTPSAAAQQAAAK